MFPEPCFSAEEHHSFEHDIDHCHSFIHRPSPSPGWGATPRFRIPLLIGIAPLTTTLAYTGFYLMKSLVFYLCGVATPFVIVGISILIDVFRGHKEHSRYKRAWDKFSEEFDALSPDELAELRKRWGENPLDYGNVCDDRSRYFKMRWQHGHTNEV